MQRIDGALSNIAQTGDPTALVVCETTSSGEIWTLQRDGHPPIGLGDSFYRARTAIRAWLKSQVRGRPDQKPDGAK